MESKCSQIQIKGEPTVDSRTKVTLMTNSSKETSSLRKVALKAELFESA